ncbi:hypothetical protein NIES2101_40930 [Calothrix sp. HK-06]|nr:hypothetical protein NIES2101_40930 [Calothrix sp. HK-06]
MEEDKGYTLATGESGTYRLQILNAIHKPYTEFLMQQVGLKEGMRVADIGCFLWWVDKQAPVPLFVQPIRGNCVMLTHGYSFTNFTTGALIPGAM